VSEASRRLLDPLVCARHAVERGIAVVRQPVAAPGDVPVGPRESGVAARPFH
jgi:hypothetical protein